MSAEPLRVLHIAPHAAGYGGIETLVERHVWLDAELGFDARQIGLFNRPAGKRDARFRATGFGWQHTPRAMRRAMAEACAEAAESVVVWHNAWGLPWFADTDRSWRRIVVLHADRGYFAHWLPQLRAELDGVLAVNPAATEAARALLPGFPAERIVCLPLLIEPPAGDDLARPPREKWLIGCAGRLERAQKRWDRLPACVRELRRLGVDFELEIIGDGRLRPWLERELAGDMAVRFSNKLEKAEYWRRLRTWDAALFFSDVEGGPLVLLEAMAMGALPVYPRIGGSLGDAYVPPLDERLYYAAGDPVAAARGLRDVLAEPAEKIAALRTRAKALVAAHRPAAYASAYRELVRAVHAAPRLSRVPSGVPRARWFDRLPLGLITRAFPRALWAR